jgi:hypothetical protein
MGFAAMRLIFFDSVYRAAVAANRVIWREIND